MQKCGASTASLDRLDVVYDVYARRSYPFAAIENELPQDVRVLALITGGNEPTAAWWKPYGSRRCLYLLSENEVNTARAAGVQYVVLTESACRQYFHTDIAGWLETHQARPVKTVEVKLLAAVPPFSYTLAQFQTGSH
jgi:hypothetical protein